MILKSQLMRLLSIDILVVSPGPVIEEINNAIPPQNPIAGSIGASIRFLPFLDSQAKMVMNGAMWRKRGSL